MLGRSDASDELVPHLSELCQAAEASSIKVGYLHDADLLAKIKCSICSCQFNI